MTALIFASWLAGIAVLSIQNIRPLALRFLTWQSVEIPFGVMLSFSVGVGCAVGAIAPSPIAARRPQASEPDPLEDWEDEED
ncbi:DUF1049 domain-containing protein [Rubidibacter lacunae]|nr:DUF1049 domain-containing protein [Rubidibacter lacunae]